MDLKDLSIFLYLKRKMASFKQRPGDTEGGAEELNGKEAVVSGAAFSSQVQNTSHRAPTEFFLTFTLNKLMWTLYAL